ncbi:hypothetical protein, partial [Vibrio harveyi]|uniref:hypothetical protein n=1 Tax=Vibrio harveyi TaxID=669 RepID=UPI00406811F0
MGLQTPESQTAVAHGRHHFFVALAVRESISQPSRNARRAGKKKAQLSLGFFFGGNRITSWCRPLQR